MFETGLEFVRVDFHLHTQKDKEFLYSGEQNDFVKSYISIPILLLVISLGLIGLTACIVALAKRK